jgi:ubiquinone/menaquinone biosynthesis C-methylase UbiE
MKRYKAIAQYYDAENARHEILRNDVPFFLGQLPRRPQDILEVAVGTGRAAIPIAQAGHRVVGVDYSRDMLDIARRKRDGVGLTDRQLKLLHGDATKLRLRQKFDWIAIFFNTFLAFPELAEMDAVLQGVRRHLKPQGRFWVDLFHPDYHRIAIESDKGIERDAFFVPELNRTVFRQTDITRDMARQVMHATFKYKWFDEFGVEKRAQFSFDMAVIFPRELQLLLERNGLKIERLFGNYDGSALHDDSPRMIARCCRA